MFELVKSGGWLMVPILLCSIAAVAIVIERLWFLRKSRVAPLQLLLEVQQAIDRGDLNDEKIKLVLKHSPLGRILGVSLLNMDREREIMKDAIEETGRHVVHELERYLNSLGTIAAITPLLGLLGTVIGMIKVFAAITAFGVGDPTILAGGISEALITTATGLSIGIPSLMFHRYFRGRINELTIGMEQAALHLVEFIHGERDLAVESETPARHEAP